MIAAGERVALRGVGEAQAQPPPRAQVDDDLRAPHERECARRTGGQADELLVARRGNAPLAVEGDPRGATDQDVVTRPGWARASLAPEHAVAPEADVTRTAAGRTGRKQVLDVAVEEVRVEVGVPAKRLVPVDCQQGDRSVAVPVDPVRRLRERRGSHALL